MMKKNANHACPHQPRTNRANITTGAHKGQPGLWVENACAKCRPRAGQTITTGNTAVRIVQPIYAGNGKYLYLVEDAKRPSAKYPTHQCPECHRTVHVGFDHHCHPQISARPSFTIGPDHHLDHRQRRTLAARLQTTPTPGRPADITNTIRATTPPIPPRRANANRQPHRHTNQCRAIGCRAA